MEDDMISGIMGFLRAGIHPDTSVYQYYAMSKERMIKLAETYKISRCPVCGGEIHISRFDNYSPRKVVTASFYCIKCGYEREIQTNYKDSAEKDAINKWNEYADKHSQNKDLIEKSTPIDCVNCKFYNSHSEFCRKHYKAVFPISFCYDGEEQDQKELSSQKKSRMIIKKFVIEEVRRLLHTDTAAAWDIVDNSFFPEVLDEMPKFVQHYDAEYWAREIIEDMEDQGNVGQGKTD